MKFVSALLFAATVLIATLTVTTAFAADACTIGGMTPSCTGGTITQDTTSGSCRTIVCSNGGDNIKALACDKGSGNFELYKQAQSGSSVSKVCLGSACVGSSGGFARSTLTCSATTPTVQPITTSPSTTTSTQTSSVTDVSQLAVTCTASGCSKTRDTWDSTCRYTTHSTSSGDIRTTACEKSGGIEVYRNSYPNTNFKVCYSGACVDQYSGFAKLSTTSTTTTPTAPTTSTPTTSTSTYSDIEYYNGMKLDAYKVHSNTIATIFWVGQGPSADTGWTNNYDSAWDTWWTEHYGGYDDPNNRNGWYPAGFTPKENPFYVAIPYTDFGNAGRKSDAFNVVPWSDEKSSWGYQESMIKNRWVKITKGSKTVYAQVENSGPGPTDDWRYVFGTDSQPNTNFGHKAGIDVSPAVRDYISMGPVDTVDWQFVPASAVPPGPWKNIVTTRQSCWASTLSACG